MRYRTTKKRRIAAVLAAAVLCAPLAACSALGGAASSSDMPMMAPSVDASGASGAAESMVRDGVSLDGRSTIDLASTAAQGAARSIISTGGITLEVQQTKDAVEAVREIAAKLGGYVESQTVSSSYGESASLALRVPAARFDEAFAQLGGIGKVLDENRSSSDVTAQHVDLQARVEALEASIERLTELMSGAASTGELIEAESALTQRQAELDGLQAQLTSLEGQIGEATIWVSLTTERVLPAGGPSNFWEGLLAGLNSITVAGAGLLVVLGVLLPWLVIAGVVAFAIVWIVRSRRKAKLRRAQAALPSQHAATEHPLPEQQAPQPEVTPGA